MNLINLQGKHLVNLQNYLEVYLPELGNELQQRHFEKVRVLLLFLYSVFKNYRLFHTSEDVELEKENEDTILGHLILYAYRDKDYRGIYKKMLEGRSEEFLNIVYPALLEEIEELVYERGKDVVPPIPYSRHCSTAECLANTLNGLGIETVFDLNREFTTMSRYLSPGIRYVADFRDPENPRKDNCATTEEILLAEVQLASRDNGSMLISTLPFNDYPDSRVDAVVSCRDHLDLTITEIEEMAKQHSARYVIIGVGVSTLDRIRFDLSSVGHLMRVDRVLGSHLYVLVFDMKEYYSEVEYWYGETLGAFLMEKVPYSEIQMCFSFLNTEIYVHPPIKEGMELKRISELADPANMQDTIDLEEGYRIPMYSLSSQLDVVCSPLHRPVMAPYASPMPIWMGRNLHVSRTMKLKGGKILQCRSDVEGCYTIEGDVDLSLHVKEDIISTEYLACALASNDMFKAFMGLKFAAPLCMRYKIPVFTDRQKQKDAVRMELEKLRGVVNSDGVYSVICVGDSFQLKEQERMSLESWNIIVLAVTSTVYGNGGLKELIADKAIGGRVEAILIDPMTDACGSRLKGFQRALQIGREYSVPVFAYSATPLDSVADDLEEDDLQYSRKGHYFEAGSEDSLRRLVTGVRDVLDSDGTLGQQLRVRHAREFNAANWIQDHWGIDVPGTLLDALSFPNKHLPQVRESVESLLKKIASLIAPGTLLDQTKGGWLAKFYLSRAREDNEKTHKYYVLEGKLMEKTLAASVDFMYQILNGASHGGESVEEAGEMNVLSYIGDVGTQNVAMAVLHIYMDFIVWLAATAGKFGVRCIVKDSRDEISIDISGTVRRVSAGEYYIETDSPEYGKIHFWPGRERVVPDGTSIVVNSVIVETKNRDKYRWFAYKWAIPSEDRG